MGIFNASPLFIASSDPGATECLLKTNTSGYLHLAGLGVGTSSPAVKAQVNVTTNSESMTLGTPPTGLGVAAASGLYGLYTGVGNSGNAWLQVGRVDGTATAYDLLLQPSGGNVKFPGTGTWTSAGKLGVGINASLTYKAQVVMDSAVASDGLGLDLYSATADHRPMVIFRRGRGTKTSPTAVESGDVSGSFSFMGYTGAGGYLNGSTIRAEIDGAVTSACNPPMSLQFFTAPGGLVSEPERMRITSTGRGGFGTTSPSGQWHVDQASTTAAIPVLLLDQADDSEEMIEFTATIGVGDPIEAIGAKALTTTHFIRCTLTGVGYVYIPVGTIA